MRNHYIIIAALSLTANACTQQLPNSFRYKQQEQSFASQKINTSIDLLWVVDNSASMDVVQEKLRQGFSSFAQTYMKPTWNIRLAVITTDTYMAHSAFNNYRNRVISGSVGWSSTYINSRLATFQNPSWNSNLVNLSTGVFTNGIKYGELVPLWGPDYAKLLPGNHDGPITGFCFEILPYFFKGVTNCKIRDDQNAYNGTSNCLNPNTLNGEDALSQCVNTVQNDTVRSGKPIINTKPPAGTAGDHLWTQQLINNAMINLTTGSVGQGSERGLGSLLQLLSDNESTGNAFFREGTLRGIIFVSDEEDQTMSLPSSPATTFQPFTDYKCDQTSLVTLNGTSGITGNNGYCCSTPSNNCSFGALGTSCPSKTVDGYTYTISVCADESKLIPVSTVKNTVDQFFNNLDKTTSNPNYFVVSIVPLTGSTIQSMQTARTQSDSSVGTIKTHAVDRGDRYIALGNLVGNGSMSMDIGVSNYNSILDAIGKQILEKTGTFTLDRPATTKDEMTLMIKKASGGTVIVQHHQYSLSGNVIKITDLDLVLSFEEGDSVVINYQPNAA